MRDYTKENISDVLDDFSVLNGDQYQYGQDSMGIVEKIKTMVHGKQ